MLVSTQTCCPEQKGQQFLGRHSDISQVRHNFKLPAMEWGTECGVQAESAILRWDPHKASTFCHISGVLAGAAYMLTSHFWSQGCNLRIEIEESLCCSWEKNITTFFPFQTDYLYAFPLIFLLCIILYLLTLNFIRHFITYCSVFYNPVSYRARQNSTLWVTLRFWWANCKEQCCICIALAWTSPVTDWLETSSQFSVFPSVPN